MTEQKEIFMYRLDIKEYKGVEYPHSFILTLEELKRLAFIAENITSDIPTHIKLDYANIDAYRLGDNLEITYPNNGVRTIEIELPYHEIKVILIDAIAKIEDNDFYGFITIESK